MITEKEYLEAKKIIERYEREQLTIPVVSEMLHHVCGLQGYNPMIDPPCQACEERYNSR